MVSRPSDAELCSRDASARKPGCKSALSFDFRETAPTGSHPTMFVGDAKASLFGGLSIGVPGELRGLEAAYREHGGGVSWHRLFEPSIRLAEKWHVSLEMERRLKVCASCVCAPADQTGLRSLHDRLERVGGRLRQGQQAQAFSRSCFRKKRLEVRPRGCYCRRQEGC